MCKPTCDATHLDCNLNGRDGCEVDKAADAKNCGVCGHVCSTNGASAAACVAGVCKPTCSSGRGDCNKDPNDGCEADLTKEVASCGACGHACDSKNTTATACVASACKPACAIGFGDCTTPASSVADNGCEASLNVFAN